MLVADVMTCKVETVAPGTAIADIARTMVEKRISAVPVVDPEGRLLGLVSEGDLLQRVETGTEGRRAWWLDLFVAPETRAETFLKAHGRIAADVMVKELVTATADMPLARAAQLMHDRRVKRLPVVEDGRIVGIVARSDLVRALAAASRPAAPSGAPGPAPDPASDLAIKDQFEATARKAGFATVGAVSASVEDGVVHLWGLAANDAERRALEVAAAGIPGVRGVDNHLAVREGLPIGL